MAAISLLAVCLIVLPGRARALTSALEELYSMNSLQPFSPNDPGFGGLARAGSPAALRLDAPLKLPRAAAPPPAKAPPFVIDIPAVPPAPFVRTFNRLRARRQTNGYDDLIRIYAVQKSLDPRLVKSVIAAESEFTPRAQSPAGALGLMQVMPETAGFMGVAGKTLFDPEANIRAGTAYLAYLFDRAWKRYHLRGVAFDRAPAWLIQRIVAAYNAGPRFLARLRLYRQTREYVRRVLLFYRSAVTDLKS